MAVPNAGSPVLLALMLIDLTQNCPDADSIACEMRNGSPNLTVPLARPQRESPQRPMPELALKFTPYKTSPGVRQLP
jgi:hypothetical protein